MIKPGLPGSTSMSEQERTAEMREILPDPSQDLQPTCWSLLAERGDKESLGITAALEQNGELGRCGLAAVAFIDRYSFTRDCIAASLQAAGTDLRIVPHASCADVLKSGARYDLLLLHWHGGDGEFAQSEAAASQLRSLTGLGPVVVLGESERPELISAAFANGARGYIPVSSTSAGLAIKIIRLVNEGGTFVPLSSLPSPDAHRTGRPGGTIPPLTPREKAVLQLLKQGKANKVIAHQLSLSETTVKSHIRHIMRKMKVRNRTEAVCFAYGTQPAEPPMASV